MSELTHIDRDGNAVMVEVGEKAITAREATAEGWIELSPEAFTAVTEGRIKKGDVLAIAQLAGIQAAKRTSDIIPLCHPIPIDGVKVEVEAGEGAKIHVRSRVRCSWKTGVEMEALTATSAALLTVYDMVKAIDKGMVIGPIHLVEKAGGRSGHWVR